MEEWTWSTAKLKSRNLTMEGRRTCSHTLWLYEAEEAEGALESSDANEAWGAAAGVVRMGWKS
jgi:hypothetical protein